MVQDVKKKNEAVEAGKRLQEISEIKFGELSDDEILELLAERKRLVELKSGYERLKKEEEEKLRKEKERLKKEEEDRLKKEQERLQKEKEEKERLRKEEEKRLALEQERAEKREAFTKKKQALVKEIGELNQAISPAKADDDLLMLIAQRKKLEKELQNIELQLLSEPAEAAVKTEEKMGKNGEMGKEQEKEEKIEPEKKAEPLPSFRESLKKEFGEEEIEEDFPEGGELHRYLTQLKNNIGSLGTLLQEMPADAKKNKAFMLQVAEIDPAYAMHYADNELKKNEDFNIKVASLKNPRNSGNALAEMLPEARTSRVVLAAVKQDYRNVKFIQPNMEDYDEIMRIAKKATLEKLQSLKSAADMLLIIPRPLQQDRQFMEEAKNIMSGENQKSA